MAGSWRPEGPDGPRIDHDRTTSVNVRNRTGEMVATYSYEWKEHPYTRTLFVGPYLCVGYNGRGDQTRCIYVYYFP